MIHCSDEDAHSSSRGIDPTCTRHDLSSDAIKYYEDRIQLANELWDNVLDKFEKDGERYPKIRSVFSKGIREYIRSIANTAKFVGGIFHRRDHIGDPNGRIPFEVVSATKQREAVQFLSKNILNKHAFNFSPELLNKLAPDRLGDFKGTPWRMSRIDFPIPLAPPEMIATLSSSRPLSIILKLLIFIVKGIGMNVIFS